MPWFKKDDTEVPEKLRNMSPDDLVNAVEKSKTLETEITTTKTELDAQKAANEELRQRLDRLEKNTAPKPEPRGKNEPTSFLVDEEQAFNERMATHPVTAIALQGAMLAAKREAIDSLQKRSDKLLWSKYSSEVEAIMAKESPERRVLPQAWHSAFVYVKGLHAEDIAKLSNEEENFFSTEPVSSGSNGGKIKVEEKKEEALTEKELAICKAMKIKPEDYLANKKAMTVVTA